MVSARCPGVRTRPREQVEKMIRGGGCGRLAHIEVVPRQQIVGANRRSSGNQPAVFRPIRAIAGRWMDMLRQAVDRAPSKG